MKELGEGKVVKKELEGRKGGCKIVRGKGRWL